MNPVCKTMNGERIQFSVPTPVSLDVIFSHSQLSTSGKVGSNRNLHCQEGERLCGAETDHNCQFSLEREMESTVKSST
jgi:hypothetical protein